MSKYNIAEIEKGLTGIGLSDKESEIMIILYKNGTLKPSDIARQAKSPRSSVVLILNSLLQKGYIVSVTVGKHIEYKTAKPEEIELELLSRIESFKSSVPLLNSLIKDKSKEQSFKIEQYEGEAGTMLAYNKILELKRSQRVYFIEGSRSVKNKLLFKNSNILKWQSDFKKSGIIMEAIGNSAGILDVKNNKSEEVVRSHKGRMIIMHDLPSSICDFDVDIAILPDRIILFMLSDLKAVLIENTSLAIALKSMFKGLTMISNKVDLNEKINQLTQ